MLKEMVKLGRKTAHNLRLNFTGDYPLDGPVADEVQPQINPLVQDLPRRVNPELRQIRFEQENKQNEPEIVIPQTHRAARLNTGALLTKTAIEAARGINIVSRLAVQKIEKTRDDKRKQRVEIQRAKMERNTTFNAISARVHERRLEAIKIEKEQELAKVRADIQNIALQTKEVHRAIEQERAEDAVELSIGEVALAIHENLFGGPVQSISLIKKEQPAIDVPQEKKEPLTIQARNGLRNVTRMFSGLKNSLNRQAEPEKVESQPQETQKDEMQPVQELSVVYSTYEKAASMSVTFGDHLAREKFQTHKKIERGKDNKRREVQYLHGGEVRDLIARLRGRLLGTLPAYGTFWDPQPLPHPNFRTQTYTVPQAHAVRLNRVPFMLSGESREKTFGSEKDVDPISGVKDSPKSIHFGGVELTPIGSSRGTETEKLRWASKRPGFRPVVPMR